MKKALRCMALFLCLVLLSACQAQPKPADPSISQVQPSLRPAFTLDAYRLEQQPRLIDLSRAVPAFRSLQLTHAAFSPQGELLLLYAAENGAYRLCRFDPATGACTLKSAGTFPAETDVQALSLVSISPLILLDEAQATVYSAQGSDFHVLSLPAGTASCLWNEADDSLYFTCDAALWRLEPAAGEMQPVFSRDSRLQEATLLFLTPEHALLHADSADGVSDVTLAVQLTDGIPDRLLPGEAAMALEESAMFAAFCQHQPGVESTGMLSALILQQRDAAAGAVSRQYTLTAESGLLAPPLLRADGLCLTLNTAENGQPLALIAADIATGQTGTLPLTQVLAAGARATLPAASGIQNGMCLVTATEEGSGAPRFLLWEIQTDVSMEEDPLPAEDPPLSPALQYGDSATYCAALSRQYGIRILTGADACLDFPDYRMEAETDEVILFSSLEELEKALRRYPPGFFNAFKTEGYAGLCLCLGGHMTPITPGYIENPSAFACEVGNEYTVAFNLDYSWMLTRNLHHETAHIIDRKLNSQYTYDGWSEWEWSRLNPEDFTYYYAYIDENGGDYEWSGSDEYTALSNEYLFEERIDNVYFVDVYARTYPTEDRARLFETVMTDDPLPLFMQSPHIRAKLAYYFAAIRGVWNTDGWPEQTYWEEQLNSLQ